MVLLNITGLMKSPSDSDEHDQSASIDIPEDAEIAKIFEEIKLQGKDHMGLTWHSLSISSH